MEVGKACEVHGVLLVPMKVPVIYGNPVFDEPYFKAVRELFPNSIESVVTGGCMAGVGESEREAFVCHACREAEAAWRKQNNRGF